MLKKIKTKYIELSLVGKATLWYLFCTVLQKSIAIITTPIFTRLMTAEQFGEFNVYISWMNILTVIITLSLSAGVFTQGLIKYEDEKKELANAFQGLNLVLCIFWGIVYSIFKDFFNKMFGISTLEMYFMLLMIWSTAVFNLWAMEQRVDYKYKGLAFYTIIVVLLQPILSGLFVFYADDKVFARILGMVIVQLAVYSIIFFRFSFNLKNFYSPKYWKYGLWFSIPILPHYLAQIILASSDKIMIAHFISDSKAGLYSLSYSLAQVTSFFSMALLQSISPWIYRVIKFRNIENLKDVGYISIYLIGVVNLLLIAFAPELVYIFAPKEYMDSIWVLPPVAITNILIYIYSLFSPFEFYFERKIFITVSTLIAAVLNFGLNYILLPKFGYLIAAYTTLFSYLVYALMHYLFMRYICYIEFNGKIPYSLLNIGKIFMIFLCIGNILMYLYSYPMLRYSFILLIFVSLYIKRLWIIQKLTYILKLKDNRINNYNER